MMIPELGRDLVGHELEVWEGRLLHPNLCKYWQDLWRSESPVRKIQLPPVAERTTPHIIMSPLVALPIARPNVCEFLENRAEFKHGCGGWRCLHGCEKGLPAVPGTYCQTCSQYVDSGEKFQ